MPRTREWKDAIKINELHGDTRVLVIEPGDMTRYDLMVTQLDNRVCAHMGLPLDSYIVCNHNLSSMFTAMTFFTGQYLSWRHVKEHLHVHAPGSCWMITEILSHFYSTQCQSYEEFEQSVDYYQGKKS